MPLPTLETPTYTLSLPSTKQKVDYRPFLVKEEKVLMIAQQSEDQTAIFRAMLDVVDACTFGKLMVEKLSNVDLEFILLKLRGKSVGESVEVKMLCDDCQHGNPVSINLDDIKVKYPRKKADPKIQLTDSVGVICAFPTVKALMSVKKDDPAEIIASAIETIFDADNTYSVEDETPEEVAKFIDSLTFSQLKKIQDFISSAPKISHTVKYDCKECGKKGISKVIEGAESFLAFA
ncbi:MAG TPA: baseplate protein [Nitrospinae bacterium]|nr:baseplate protein [Nitrospinota bacterium]